MPERTLESYLTGLKKTFSNHNGEHANAVFVMKGLSVNAIGENGQPQSCEIVFQGFHSEEFFAAGQKALDGANISCKFPNRTISFDELQAMFPVHFLIVANLARRIAKELPNQADGNSFFADAQDVELPDWAKLPEITKLLNEIESLEESLRK